MSKCNETGERIQVIANILNYCLLYRERTSVVENIGVDPEQVGALPIGQDAGLDGGGR